MNQVKEILEVASIKAAGHVAMMKAYYVQLKTIDEKTYAACSQLCDNSPVEPDERERLAEQLVILQRSRTELVNKIKTFLEDI